MADLVLVNANVLTMDPGPAARPRAGAVAITGGRIQAVAADASELGADLGAVGAVGVGRVVDLRGATLLPGFQALYAYTAGSAYASHQEHVKGSITAGKLADLVVLSEDPTAVSPDRIAGLEVLATLIDGQCRYHSGAIDGLS